MRNDILVSRTISVVVVDYAAGLQMRINSDGAEKFETAFF